MPEPNEPPGDAEVLSQSEVERLLAQVTEQEDTQTVLSPTPDSQVARKDLVQPYHFPQPVFLAAAELRRLRIRHEEFTRALSARLSIYMRLEVTLQLAKLHTIPY